jgi:hypothetical protein
MPASAPAAEFEYRGSELPATCSALRPPSAAAPAESSAAASFPRLSPRSPPLSCFWRSCFSISVTLAQKIAGKARNSPPVPVQTYWRSDRRRRSPATKHKTQSIFIPLGIL